MGVDDRFDLQFVLDGLGQGILIFDSDDKLVAENLAARTLLATDLNLVRENGWAAASALFNATLNVDETVDRVRTRALESERPVRFRILRSGEYLPCWAAAIQGKSGEVYTMITLESPDWNMVNDTIDRFRGELRSTLDDTLGHISLINKTIDNQDPDAKASELAKRVSNFTQLIAVHMARSTRFVDMFDRLQNIRTHKTGEIIRANRKKIELTNYFEDFLEELDEIDLIDPETEARDHRSRITTEIPGNLAVYVPQRQLTIILHDILRNAIMYSLRGTEIKIIATHKNDKMIQLDIKDEGYGIREKERSRVFTPFQRARQPQIISEFGYGLSLYLCKYEVETMGGQLWFESEEGIGTTFSMNLPPWREEIETESESESSESNT